MSRPESHTVYQFGDFHLDASRRLLFAKGAAEPCAIAPKTFETILYFVEHAGELLQKDRLMAELWPGVVVEENSLTQNISVLRRVLGEARGENRYIATVPGRGYRFVADVTRLHEVPDIARPMQSLPPAARSNSDKGPRWKVLVPATVTASALLIALLAYGWYVRFHSETRASNVHSAVERGDAQAPRSSIAVLPFVDLSPARDQQYLADGIAEEILNLLSKSTTLRVIARTSSFSFRDKDTDVRHVAEALRVTHVLEGTVRKAEDRIRISVRLVDASDGSPLWSESYDRHAGDVLALQTDIARAVAAELKVNLQYVAGVAGRRVNAAAYDLYLQGQEQLRLMLLEEAVRYFERTIEMDPEFMPGYYGLGVAYVLQISDVQVAATKNRERLREVLRRGRRLAPDDPGLLGLSALLARYDGNIALAEKQFATALQRDPTNNVLRDMYLMFKVDQGYAEEALAVGRGSIEIDPKNSFPYIGVWGSHMDLWNVDEAMKAAAQVQGLMAASDPCRQAFTTITRWYLSGDLAGSKGYLTAATAQLQSANTNMDIMMWLAEFYYFIDDLQTADTLMELARPFARHADAITIEAYRHLAHGNVHEARRLAVSALTAPKIWGGNDEDFTVVRLATDALIESGEARRLIDFLESLAPEYARYKSRTDIDPKDFWPAPVALKSAYSSYPALYFPDYIRALRTVGDEAGANRMLDHLEGVLELRRKRGLFLEERHAAEALALRGRTEAALDALEKGERDRTIYHRWHLVLLHNEMFAGLRNHPRFLALVERIRRDVSRQRDELSRVEPVARDPQ